MSKPVYILGTGLSNDGSSCLMRDGRIVVAIEKERLTKQKHDGFNDDLTIQYCLDAAGITIRDVDLVVEQHAMNDELRPHERALIGRRALPPDLPTVSISHHLAHAYSAAGTSPFDEATVVVIDGHGDALRSCIDVADPAVLPEEVREVRPAERHRWIETSSVYHFTGDGLRPVFKDFSPWHVWDRRRHMAAPFHIEHSIGEFYAGVTYYVFDDAWCEGKLMGLAPYGRPGRFPFRAFDLEGGRVRMRRDWIEQIDPGKAGKFQCFHEYFPYYADLARWAQDELERAVLYVFAEAHRRAPSRNVAYAGGVALNAVTNHMVTSRTPFQDIYIQPAAGDNGLAIGCCYYGWLEVMKRAKVPHDGTTYFGRTYPEDEVLAELARHGDLQHRACDDIAAEVAALLASDEVKVVAWYQGGAEFGPRALGNRSLLADPRHPEIRNYVNRKIKSREEFRPFAPSVTEAAAPVYFEGITSSPHMLLIAQTRDAWKPKIPGVVHKDGTARVQTVTPESNPRYHRLLEEFGRRTGLPMLVNTSLNGRGMPIVETPADVIALFVSRPKIDALVIGDRLITRAKAEPPPAVAAQPRGEA